MIRSYDSLPNVQEEPVDDLTGVLGRRKELGGLGVGKEMIANVHERGVRLAGDYVLPVWGLGLSVLVFALGFVGGILGGIFASLTTVLVGLWLPGIWVVGPLLIYWDCKAGERYLGNSWRLGKLIAAGSLLVPVIGFVFQIKYRSRKFDEIGS